MGFKRGHRLAAITKILSDNPNRTLTFSNFTERFSTAKSTISADVAYLKTIFEDLDMGKIVTITGASGGVKYIPNFSKKECSRFIKSFCEKLSSKERILPGGFLYMIDLIYDPFTVEQIARSFASMTDYSKIDYLVTIETKGIPMAIMTSKLMNLPLLIIRKNAKISEGPSINIAYVSGKNFSKVQTMSLPIKSVKRGSKVILIDDFMRGGGTLKGMHDLMHEFRSEVVSSLVVISTEEPEVKKVKDYKSLIILDRNNNVRPSSDVMDNLNK